MENMKKSVESFDDIIFENRNKDYGAYELRKNYGKRGKIALSIALFIVLVAVGLPLIASFMKEQNVNNWIDKGVVIDIENIKDKPKIDIPKLPEPPKTDIKSIIYKPVDSLINDEETDITEDIIDNTTNLPIDTSIHQDLVIVDNDNDFIDEKPLEKFEITEQPMFPGGDDALIKYILDNVKYPTAAQENGIEGTVYIRFVVTKTGDIGEVQVYKPADPLLNDAASQVVKNLPKWTPGKKNGNPVNVWFIVPIKFKLQN